MVNKVLLSEDEVSKILSLVDNPEWFNSKTVDFNKNSLYSPNIRKSEECNVDNEVIESILLPKLTKYNIKSITGQTIILKYNEGCYFKEHRDRIDHNPHTSNRQQTLIVQLSDKEDYKGGELIVNKLPASKDKGTLVLFDSNELHELKTLTSGVRYCLVTWLTANDYNKRGLM